MSEKKVVEIKEEIKLEDMPLKTLADYVRYNKRVREINKGLKKPIVSIKQPPTELHPHDTVVFNRTDQPNNELPVYISDDMIHFEDKLKPNQKVKLPRYVIEYLAKKATPFYKTIDQPDGTKKTVVDHEVPRFSFRTVYEG